MAAVWFRRVRLSDAPALAAIRLAARHAAMPGLADAPSAEEDAAWLETWWIRPALGEAVLDPPPLDLLSLPPGRELTPWRPELEPLHSFIHAWDPERACFIPAPGKTYDPEGMLRSLPHMEVAMMGHQAVGFIAAHAGDDWYNALPGPMRRGLDPAYLRHLYVAPPAQGRGIGTRLLRRMMRLGPHKGVLLHVFRGNRRAVRFYERQGFSAVPGREEASSSGEAVPLMQHPRGRGRLARRNAWPKWPIDPNEGGYPDE